MMVFLVRQLPGLRLVQTTLFVSSPKPCCVDTTADLFPFVAEDFEAPNIGQTKTTVKVTSTFGLRVGDNIRIGTGIYSLLNVLSSKQILIKNEGAGLLGGNPCRGKRYYWGIPIFISI